MISKESELHHSIGSLIDGARLGPKTDRDYLGRYCLKTFETTKGKKVFPIYQATYAVMKLRFFRNHKHKQQLLAINNIIALYTHNVYSYCIFILYICIHTVYSYCMYIHTVYSYCIYSYCILILYIFILYTHIVRICSYCIFVLCCILTVLLCSFSVSYISCNVT